MKRTTQVAHFILDHRVGGPHIYFLTLKAAMSKDVSFSLFTAGKGPLSDFALVNLRQWWRPLYALEVVVNGFIIAWKFRSHRVNKGCQQVFHVHGAANLAPLIGAIFCRVPVLWQWHEEIQSFRIFVEIGYILLKRSKNIIITVFRGHWGMTKTWNLFEIPNPVDSCYWQRPEVALSSQRSCAQVTRLLAVGNVSPVKGFDVLLNSLALLHSKVHLKIIGAALDTHQQYFLSLNRLARKISAAHSNITIEFMGWQEKESIRQQLCWADVFVLPSRSEAYPIALLEAMSMEMVCIATDVGAIRNILPSEQQKLVVPPNDTVALSEAIQCAIELTSITKKNIGLANRRLIEYRNSPSAISASVHKLYIQLLTGALVQRH